MTADKAWLGGALAGILIYLFDGGFSQSFDINDLIQAIVGGGATGGTIYLKRNRPKVTSNG